LATRHGFTIADISALMRTDFAWRDYRAAAITHLLKNKYFCT
jgi:hypothetical protein